MNSCKKLYTHSPPLQRQLGLEFLVLKHPDFNALGALMSVSAEASLISFFHHHSSSSSSC